MEQTKVLLCENSFEGIMSGVYDGWIYRNRYGRENVRLQCSRPDNYNLFYEYINLNTSIEKAVKVSESVKKKFNGKVFYNIYMTAVSEEDDKADILFRYIQYAYDMGDRILECMAIPEVMSVTKICKRVWFEYDHFRGFIRFTEMDNNTLKAKIQPKNDILELLGEHFKDRLANENFLIEDIGRKKVLLHKKECDFVIYNNIVTDNGNYGIMSDREKTYEDLWRVFFDTIAIKERNNNELQRNNLPLRYRKYMTEFI